MTKSLPKTAGVLIVDDDEQLCNAMERFLKQDGFYVKTLVTPENAVKEVRSGQFHILILDLMMPKLDGIELLRQIRRFDREIAVIIFTGFPSLESALAAIKLQVMDYIQKPFDPDEFKKVLDKVLAEKGITRNPVHELHKTVGAKIRAMRRKRKLTLKQLARRTALSPSLISQIERAESSASVASLYSIATALDTTVAKLIHGF